MQIITSHDSRQFSARSYGARVMLLTAEPNGLSQQRLATFGGSVDTETEFYAALAGVIDDPMGYDILVMECDGFGGIDAGERAIVTLIAAEARMRVILISEEFDVPAFPMGKRTAVCLPASVSEAGFRTGFDHVLRDRMAVRMV